MLADQHGQTIKIPDLLTFHPEADLEDIRLIADVCKDNIPPSEGMQGYYKNVLGSALDIIAKAFGHESAIAQIMSFLVSAEVHGDELHGHTGFGKYKVPLESHPKLKMFLENSGGSMARLLENWGELGISSLAGVVLSFQQPMITAILNLDLPDTEKSKIITHIINDPFSLAVSGHHMYEVVSDNLDSEELIDAVVKGLSGERKLAVKKQLVTLKDGLFKQFCEFAIKLSAADTVQKIDEMLASLRDNPKRKPPELMELSSTLWQRFLSNQDSNAKPILDLLDFIASDLADRGETGLQDFLHGFVPELLFLNMQAVAEVYKLCLNNPQSSATQSITEALIIRYDGQLRLIENHGSYDGLSISDAVRGRGDTILTDLTAAMILESTVAHLPDDLKEGYDYEDIKPAVRSMTTMIGILNDIGPKLAETSVDTYQMREDLEFLYQNFPLDEVCGNSKCSLSGYLAQAYKLGLHRGIELTDAGAQDSIILTWLAEHGCRPDPNHPNRFSFPKGRLSPDAKQGLLSLAQFPAVCNIPAAKVLEPLTFLECIEVGLFDYNRWVPYYTLMKDCAQGERNIAATRAWQRTGQVDLDEQIDYLLERIQEIQLHFQKRLQEFQDLVRQETRPIYKVQLAGLINFLEMNGFHYGLATDYDDKDAKGKKVTDMALGYISKDNAMHVSKTMFELMKLREQLL